MQQEQKELLKKKPKFKGIIERNLQATKDIEYDLIVLNKKAKFIPVTSMANDYSQSTNYTKVLGGVDELYTTLNPLEIFRKNRYFPENIIKVDPIHWTLVNEKKNVLGFSCYKAIGITEIKTTKGKLLKNTIIAWYTNEIPIPFGPKDLSGLPGLVIQSKDSRGLSFEYVKLEEKEIKLNDIKRPNGTIISNDEFQSKIQSLKNQFN